MQLHEMVLFAGVLLGIPLTLVWMVVHGHGLFSLGAKLNEVSRRAQITWLLSVLGGFTGPCVIPISLGALGMAVVERQKEPSEATARALRTIIIAGLIILTESVVFAAAGLVSLVLAP